MATRDEFVEALKAKIDEWNGDIATLEQRMKAASDEAEARYAEQIAEASKFRAEAQAKLAESLKSSGDAWDGYRENMERAWDDIAEGFRKAWSRFD